LPTRAFYDKNGFMGGIYSPSLPVSGLPFFIANACVKYLLVFISFAREKMTMSRILEFFKNDHIKIALMTGACIIILAVVFKRIMRVEMTNLESGVPGLFFILYELVSGKKDKSFRMRPLYWNLIILAATAIIIIVRIL